MSSSSFHGRKKANEGGGGPDASRKSLTASRSMYVSSAFFLLFIFELRILIPSLFVSALNLKFTFISIY